MIIENTCKYMAKRNIIYACKKLRFSKCSITQLITVSKDGELITDELFIQYHNRFKSVFAVE